MRSLVALLGLGTATAVAPPLELSTGTLHFSPNGGAGKASFKSGAPTVPVAGLNAPATGSWAFTVSPSIIGTAEATLNAAMKGCGHVQSYLHPNSFHVHVKENEGACLAAAGKVAGVEGVAYIPSELRTDPQVMGGSTREFPPLRMLTLTMVHNASFPGVEADLTPTMLAQCPECVFIAPELGDEVFITALGGQVCDAKCQLDSPLDCGCTLPEPLVRFAAGHRDVAWTGRVEQVYTANAFGRGMMETTDIANAGPLLIREYGTCTDGTCNHAGDLPFSQLPTLFPGPFASTHGADTPSTIAQAPASSVLAPVPRRTGLNFSSYNYTAILASIPDYATAAGLRSDIGTCNAACSGLACGFGFGLCSDLVSPTFLAGLTGNSQIIQVADTGLDVGLPFFFDGTPGAAWLGPAPGVGAAGTAGANPMYFQVQPTGPATPNPPVQPPSVPGHRKIVGYWSYADSIDNVNGRGHGTHVGGSVLGDAAGIVPATLLQPADAVTLSAMKGSASGARVIVGDIGCSTPGGCARAGVVPARAGGCGNNALCIPAAIGLTFEGARQQGARVSCNSWGGGANSNYVAGSVALDTYVRNVAEDMLLVFAAANSGGGGFYTISSQAVSKNVLAVAALSDGFLAHRTKTLGMPGSGTPTPPATTTVIPPLYQALDGRSCGAIVLNAAANNAISLQPTGLACPATPTPAQCWAMTVDGQTNIPNVPGGFGPGSQYGGTQQAELAMCCGCTLAAVVAGCQLPGNPCAAAPPAGPAALSLLLQGFTSVYNGRWPTVFSSLGPAGDERIKPDVGSTGFEIMSARSSSNFQYQTGPYQCTTAPGAAGAVTLSNLQAPGVTWTPFTFTVPASELFATITIAPTTEPIRLNTFSFFVSATTAGWFEMWIVSTTENGGNQAAPVRIPVAACGPGTAVPVCGNTPGSPDLYTFDLTLNGWGGWEMGSNWAGSIQLFAAPGQVVTDVTLTPGNPVSSARPCPGGSGPFSPLIGNEVQWVMNVQRGGAQGYISAMSGTSMSCPAVSGIAGLVRSFYTDGFMGLTPGCNGLVQAGFCTTAGTPPGVLTPAAGFLPTASLVKATLMNTASPIIDQDYYNFFNLPPLLRWQAQSQSGHGVPNLVRGLSFATLGTGTTTVTRAGGFLPTLLVPGLGVVNAGLGVTTAAAPGQLCGAGCEPTVATGAIHSYCIFPRLPAVPAPGVNIPLTMTLVWTDPPGAALSTVNLVNNLDLIVTPPVGPVAYGNANLPPTGGQQTQGNLANGTSTGQIPDTLNNVERLKFPVPAGGWTAAPYLVQVRGTAVPIGGSQRYSLVVTGPGIVISYGLPCTAPPLEEQQSPFSNSTHTAKW